MYNLKAVRELSETEILSRCPQLTVDTGNPETTSHKYSPLSSWQFHLEMLRLGFVCFQAFTSRTRKAGNKLYSKHCLYYTRPEYLGLEHFPMIILITSHDGSSAFRLFGGVFRGICENGMVFGYNLIQPRRIIHVGKQAYLNISKAVNEIETVFPTALATIEKMRQVSLTQDQIKSLAFASARIRFQDKIEERVKFYHKLYQTRRYQDKGESLWLVFNRIQENLIRGGNGQGFRRVSAFNENVKLNAKLWELAETYLQAA